ncbi:MULTISPECIES: plasmid mobilization relaxosome protein MobC [Vagococcus]|uniref:plasmid mobilization relaxosome protein MobC n=1 Tax=Vagococcus TaxID=2737 RepID=UPI000E47B42B|nr:MULTISPECIES: plasmid mobilization relaxosome protein MobC [Vagococcus]RHH66391.1 plasmid mobilization relaxosome protein MobC [Vagococcus sp. AM17-17]
MEKRERNVQRLIRLTQKESDYIQQKVALSRLGTFQLYAQTMLIQGEVVSVDYSELLSLVREVKRIGVNINQVVKLANEFSEISTQDIHQLTNQLTELTQLVDDTLKQETTKHTKQTEVDYFGVYKTLPNKNI